jgi:hypothetical protein
MHFVEQLNPEEITAFHQRLKEFEQALFLKAKRDEFLDAYSAWLKRPREVDLHQRLLKIIEELKQLDPGFQPEAFLSRLG